MSMAGLCLKTFDCSRVLHPWVDWARDAGEFLPLEIGFQKDRQEVGDEDPLPIPLNGKTLKACGIQPSELLRGAASPVPAGAPSSSNTLCSSFPSSSCIPSGASCGHLPNKLLALKSCFKLCFWGQPNLNSVLYRKEESSQRGLLPPSVTTPIVHRRSERGPQRRSCCLISCDFPHPRSPGSSR